MQLLKRIINVFIATGFLFLPSVASAQITPTPALDPGCIPSDLGCVPSDPVLFVAKYYSFGLSIIGGLAVLFIMAGSYIILTSRGNPQQLNNGKTYIWYSITGLLLAIFGYVFVEVIAKDILKIPGFG